MRPVFFFYSEARCRFRALAICSPKGKGLQTLSAGSEWSASVSIADSSPDVAAAASCRRRLDLRHRRSHGSGQHLTVSPSLSLHRHHHNASNVRLDYMSCHVSLLSTPPTVIKKANHDESADFLDAKVDLHWIRTLDFLS